jgi:hypothetical protein
MDNAPGERTMKHSTNGVLFVVLGIALLASLAWGLRASDKSTSTPAGPRYTVIATDGSNLVVTDNHTSKLYFYAIGTDEKIGDPLTLRGTVDLTTVGKSTITPTLLKKK